jgi:protein-tyrosine phosphatase
MTSAHLTGAIELPDGYWVRGRGLWRPTPEGIAPDFGVYLGTRRMRRRYDGDLTWPHQWIDWPDFLVPRHFGRAAADIRALHARAGAGDRVEVACGGGVGRTGTVIACLAVLAGLSAAEAIPWTRANHHPRAIETPWQRAWVGRFARAEVAS